MQDYVAMRTREQIKVMWPDLSIVIQVTNWYWVQDKMNIRSVY
jgi:hypothetical protein